MWDASRADILAKTALDRGELIVDPTAGTIIRASTGQRAEILDKRTAYGRVSVYNQPYTLAMAHRIVWIAAHGLIPATLHINHKNRHRWDNRIDNLEPRADRRQPPWRPTSLFTTSTQALTMPA